MFQNKLRGGGSGEECIRNALGHELITFSTGLWVQGESLLTLFILNSIIESSKKLAKIGLASFKMIKNLNQMFFFPNLCTSYRATVWQVQGSFVHLVWEE